MTQTPARLYSLPQAPESTKHFDTKPTPLNTGAPPFPVNEKVRQAIIKAVEASKEQLSYPPTRGIEDLRKKVAREYGYSEEGIIITYGASQALYNILDTIIGDEEVLIPAPFWFAFPNIVAQGRGRLKIIETSAEDDFKLTPRRLAQSISWKSRVLILTNPNNPTGTVYTREEMDALVKVLMDHPRLLVVSDEVYNLVLMDEKTCPSISSWPKMRDRVLLVNSLSKNYAMSGLRVGFVAAHPMWADIYLQKQNYATSGVNEFLQRGALAALEAKDEIISPIVEALKARRAKAIELLDTVPHTSYITPQAAYFFFWNIEHYIGCRTEGGRLIRSDVDLVDYLLQDANVLVVAGSLCGTPGHLRITYAIAEKQFEDAIHQIKESLQKLSC
ncbi:MAG TPA: aminotransferase class I/II-fold pyridoxal phosphate-dependent enzyme [Blastocatellia bacterium]|nr:aminotransferase class I/II-fold pyridoxal phosphate-dependent enzyme [Blastocatellia bacterium]